MPLEQNLPENYRLDLALLQETAQRIIADFESLGILIAFSGNEQTAYLELMDQLVPALQSLMSKDKQKLMRVLYKIDISEQKLTATSSRFPHMSMAEIIANLVIEREMQKAVTRRYFKR